MLNTVDGPFAKKRANNRTIVYNLKQEPLEKGPNVLKPDKITDSEFVTIYLDRAGKWTIVIAYALMQGASIFTYLANYNIYATNSCNPSIYKMPSVLIDQMQINISKNSVFITCIVFAIFFKVSSVISLYTALT